MGCHFLLQTIFPAQGSNPGLPHCRQTLYCLSCPEQVASLCPMIKEADSEPSSPHIALLGRKAGQAGALFLLWSPAFQRRRAGVLGKTPRLRGAQAGLGPSGGRHSGPRRCHLLPRDGAPTLVSLLLVSIFRKNLFRSSQSKCRLDLGFVIYEADFIPCLKLCVTVLQTELF